MSIEVLRLIREMPANNAILIIREWRPGSIEVPEQEAVVYEYEHFINTQGKEGLL